jgi:hypothetical protein
LFFSLVVEVIPMFLLLLVVYFDLLGLLLMPRLIFSIETASTMFNGLLGLFIFRSASLLRKFSPKSYSAACVKLRRSNPCKWYIWLTRRSGWSPVGLKRDE